MNNSESTLQWVRGLSEYLDFVKDDKSKMFIDFLEQSMYADNPVIDNTNQKGMIEFISILRKFAPNEIFDIFHKYYRLGFDPKYFTISLDKELRLLSIIYWRTLGLPKPQGFPSLKIL